MTITRTATRPARAGASRLVAGVLPVLVLVQAVIAGRSDRLFGSWSIVAHGVVGNTTFLVAVVGLVLVIVGHRSRVAVTVNVALVAMLIIQTGLGYSGRSSLNAAAWHIPLGVAIFGLTVYNLTLHQGRS